MVASSKQISALIDKLDQLPPERIAEVEDFVDFLSAKTSKQAALDRLLAIAPSIEAAGITPMSETEIEMEIKAARRERREQGHTPGADRT
jgi:hypothetical protein